MKFLKGSIRSPKDQKTAMLLAKIFMFGLLLIWTLIFLATGLIIYDKLFHPVMVEFFTPNLSDKTLVNKISINVCCTWYLITYVLLGIWVTLKSFKVVGQWTRGNQDNSDAASK